MCIYVTTFLSARPKLLCKLKESSMLSNATYFLDDCEIFKNVTANKLTSPYECEWDDE